MESSSSSSLENSRVTEDDAKFKRAMENLIQLAKETKTTLPTIPVQLSSESNDRVATSDKEYFDWDDLNPTNWLKPIAKGAVEPIFREVLYLFTDLAGPFIITVFVAVLKFIWQKIFNDRIRLVLKIVAAVVVFITVAFVIERIKQTILTLTSLVGLDMSSPTKVVLQATTALPQAVA